MKNIRMTLAIIFIIGCLVFLGYEFIADTDYAINFIIYDWRWKFGCIIGYLIYAKKITKKATN